MKATELLQKQHRDIEALLDRLRGAGQGEEKAIREQLAEQLVAHTAIEEEIFYPAIKESMPEEILEAIEEHGLADFQLAKLLHAKAGDAAFEAKDAVLAEIVVRHIRKEETDVFRTAEREIGEEMLHHLAERMHIRFRQVIEAGYAKMLQRALISVMPALVTRAMAAKKTPATRATRAAKKPAKRVRAAKRGAVQARGKQRATAQTRRTAKKGAKPISKQAAQQGTRRTRQSSAQRPAAQRPAAQRPAAQQHRSGR